MPRILAIGDIHGCYCALTTLCNFVELRPDDTLITLGDYTSRGPDSKSVLDWLIDASGERRLIPLRGNHDIMMLAARESSIVYDNWRAVGGDATLRSYATCEGDHGSLDDIPPAHWDFLATRLLPFFETETHFFVHANVAPDVPLVDQPGYRLYWEPFYDPPRHQSGKIMVCGHTSQSSGLPLANENAICIDTKACGAGWLSCLDVTSGEIWQANQRGQTRRLHLDDAIRAKAF